jgi:hypothetical protein
MWRYDELTLLFDPWRKNWCEQYSRHQFLPPRVAKRFQEFLGGPEFFHRDGDGPVVPYVSPTQAKWDDVTEQYNLIAYRNRVEDVSRGRFLLFWPAGVFGTRAKQLSEGKVFVFVSGQVRRQRIHNPGRKIEEGI